MIVTLGLIAVFTLGAAAVALTRRDLIHSALWLVLAWSGVAGFYLWSGAEFVAFAQVLIYAGAISMVVLFAVLLTRRIVGGAAAPGPEPAGRIVAGLFTGGLVAGVLGSAVLHAELPAVVAAPPAPGVRQLGRRLMEGHPAALLVAGAILTVALIGAVIIAASDSGHTREDPS